MKENILVTEKIPKLLIKYSIPAIIAMVIAGMETMVDGLFLGNIVGENAMASVNIAQPFYQFAIACSMMISVGSLSCMGRSLGENDKEKTENIYRTSLILLVILGGIISLAGFFFNKEIALLLGANEVLLKDTSIFIKRLSIFILPLFIMIQLGFSNRLIEKPDLYLKGTIASLCTNICVNYILVKVNGFGIQGSAIATGMGGVVGLLFVIGPQIDRRNIINIFVGKYDSGTIIPVLQNGAAEAMVAISAAINVYVFNMAFMEIAGEAGIAAFTTISYISTFAAYIMFGIGDGIGPIISYNYGAGKQNRVNKVLKLSYITGAVLGMIIFTIVFFFGRNLISIFGSTNKTVIELAVEGSKIFAIGFLINGFNILNSAYFTSIGLAKESVIIALSRGLVFIIIGIFILPKFFAINGVWMSVPFAEMITLAISCYLLKIQKNEVDVICY